MDAKDNAGRANPYVGITGFKTPDEIRMATEAFCDYAILTPTPAERGYVPMFGILSSSKRLEDPGIAGARSPRVRDLRSIFEAIPHGAFAVVHYHTKNNNRFGDEVLRLLCATDNLYRDGLCRAIQLNIAWPSCRELERVREELPGLQVILQINAPMMRGTPLETLVWGTAAYAPLAEHVLIDASGGEGKPLDIGYTAELAAGLADEMPRTRLGIAGGLSAQNIAGIVFALRGKVNEPLSVDAEGRLRTDDNTQLDPANVRAYLAQSSRVLLPA